ncbi:DNA-binding response regulator [Actinoplanes capillaceus]|uniref:DNA-binding response regulator n=1 Tax=Actinoplanes campanulatus TaxID=113559 RepID=A0ABQ3W722_9ACTN|nr:response regulator transcription factor [Actinoplanes capillaceus]GID42854.1 DNA-binding response regulator [Actinoplanes capillaceus]
MIRILIADDQPLVRAGLRTVLATDPELEIVAEAHDGRSALEAVERWRPDVVLLDIRMPGVDGLAAAESIRARHPAVRVMIITTFDEDRYIARAVQAGVHGFLLKSGDPYELIGGVKAVMNGGTVLAPPVAQRIVGLLHGRELQDRLAARTAVRVLTPRERDVLALLGAGLSNAEIGHRLHLAEGTVKIHVSALLGKLGLANRVQAAVYAYRAGLSG